MLFFRQRDLAGAALVLLTLTATASDAAAKPKPGRGFRLFASAENIFTVNRVQCRIFSDGQICATGSSTVGGGLWPRGTANQYVFGSGVNLAGIIEPGDRSVNGFAGDTAGAFFNNTGGSNNGEEVRPIFDSNDAADAATWPDEARVPCAVGTTSVTCAELGLGTDPQGDLFDPALQGSIAASQGDLWFMSWEGSAAHLESRTHPMGILVETRALGWNFPQGNEDVIYFLYTFYNITSTNEADYAAVRPSLRPILLEHAQEFQASNTARFGINIPAGGYALNDVFAAFVADMDVAQADANYATVNVPFALGVTYENVFSDCASIGCTFPPSISGPPFFPGIGFIGVKYLGSPDDPDTGEPVGLTLFGTFSRSSGSLQDPGDDKQLYRYLTGGLLPTDGACSLPNPLEAKICFVNISSPADMRFFQSSGPIDLPPGGSGTIVVAYIFAAPVGVSGCPGAACDVKPAATNADLTILGDPTRMANGVNKIDTVMGYAGNINGQPRGSPAVPDPDPTVVTQDEFLTVPGSLLRKAQTAQAVFDNKFLLPFAPERPEFFLVPGNQQVTVLWSPSPTEDPANPDPFFAVASDVTQPLYDPNFRANDVEGYRIYRGRVDNPSELQLIAQFDQAPDPATGKGIFNDFRGLVNPTPQCAPELNIFIACDPNLLPPPPPGTPFTGSQAIDLIGTITQVTPGNRVELASGEAQLLPGTLDTAFADVAAGRLGQGVSTELGNTGIPFIFVDRGVRNSLRYFYSVTAFDVNSLVSGPSSLESARVTKPVIPAPTPSNQVIQTSLARHVVGRNVGTDTLFSMPTIDPATGRFSGPMPPSDGGVVEFVGEFAGSVIQPDQGGELSMRLDSITPGQWSTTACCAVGSAGFPTNYYLTLKSPTDSFKVTAPINTSYNFPGPDLVADSTFFTALTVDPDVAQKYEGSPPFTLSAFGAVQVPSPGVNGGWGLGCFAGDITALVGSTVGLGQCPYNGSRWFDGPSPQQNETMADPTGGNCIPNAGGSTATLAATGTCNLTAFNNAGQLTGVDVIQQALEYAHFNGQWRNQPWWVGTVHRGADYNVYWGAGGVIDSVIDVSHNVVVPFSASMGSSWGVLNGTNPGIAGGYDGRATVLTMVDVGCVEPIKSAFSPGMDQRIPCGGGTAALENTAVLGDVALFKDVPENSQTAAVSGQGFMIYIVGDLFLMQMAALPAEGTVWAMRTYVGAITGGKGPGSGDTGQPYRFTPGVNPFTAVGATVAVEFEVVNQVSAATKNDLSRVHTVPDPYYVQSAYEASTDQKILKFVGLPEKAIIRIYSVSGVLVRMLEHDGSRYASTSQSQGSEFDWDLRNRNNQVVASGVYFYHIESGDARRVGRFTVVNFAQ